VGRYSERETQPNQPANLSTAAPVGFKSKVVSRRHCEFWAQDGEWFIKDVKSSSGTFLNHVRLSSPGTESKPFPVKNGDIVQLGIDFKGGEEMIFRCVKIRIEVNRAWQTGINSFKFVSQVDEQRATANMHTVLRLINACEIWQSRYSLRLVHPPRTVLSAWALLP
jgi:pSer/pThr/pTyr-binding forkhead associated (FHA) protein